MAVVRVGVRVVTLPSSSMVDRTSDFWVLLRTIPGLGRIWSPAWAVPFSLIDMADGRGCFEMWWGNGLIRNEIGGLYES
jgi:hypothetical protein